MSARSYLSQVELALTFGLGETAEVVSVRIYWPDGSTQTLTDVPIDPPVAVEQPG